MESAVEVADPRKMSPTVGALTSTFVLSLSAFAVLPLLPLVHTSFGKVVLRLMVSFAVGGLLGDVFLHIFPHNAHILTGGAAHHHGHDDHHAHSSPATAGPSHVTHGHSHGVEFAKPVLLGILFFFLVEKVVRWCHPEHSHDHCSHEHDVKGDKKESKKSDKKGGKAAAKKSKPAFSWSSALLNVFSDCLHNFTDGLALGSAWSSGHGIQATVAIFLHEVPHNIADGIANSCPWS